MRVPVSTAAISAAAPENDNSSPIIPCQQSRAPTIPCPPSFCTNRLLTKTRVLAGHGYAFAIRSGTRFRIIDLHGEQIADLFAWSAANPLERMTPSYTRYHLSGVAPAIGEDLYTNGDHPILRVVADTVKVHDMTYMACYPGLYAAKGLHGHRSCAQNVVEAMHEAGFADLVEGGVLSVPEPFNCFQNTPMYSLKAMGSSKPGDFIEFEAMMDLIVAVSCCPYDLEGFNGGEITDLAVVVSEAKTEL